MFKELSSFRLTRSWCAAIHQPQWNVEQLMQVNLLLFSFTYWKRRKYSFSEELARDYYRDYVEQKRKGISIDKNYQILEVSL